MRVADHIVRLPAGRGPDGALGERDPLGHGLLYRSGQPAELVVIRHPGDADPNGNVAVNLGCHGTGVNT